jgi:predicted transcriptional regulator
MAESARRAALRTVTIGVSCLKEVMNRVGRAASGKPEGAHVSFVSVELMWRVLTPKRWDILRAMTGESALSIREIARRVDRDVKAVHGDVTALIAAGVVDKTSRGVVFPYDEIHVDFVVTKAA